MAESTNESEPWLLPVELVLFGLIFFADMAGWIPLSKTPLLLLVASGSLWIRGRNWRSVGFAFPPMWPAWLAVGVAAGFAFWAFEFYVENPLLFWLTGHSPDMSGLGNLAGNTRVLAVLLVFNLVFVAICEQMVWRGYALSRIAEILGRKRWNWIAALVLVNALFGLALLYQGGEGVAQAWVQAILLGLLYLAARRNLLAPMAAHFTASSFDFIRAYLGHFPSVGG